MVAQKFWWFVFFLSTGMGSAGAQDTPAFSCPMARQLVKEGRLVDAYPQAQQCLLAVQQSKGINSEAYAEGLRLLTQVSAAAGDFELALVWAGREVAVRALFAEASPLCYGQALQNQGTLYLRMDSLSAAQQSLTEAERVFSASQTISPLRMRYLLAKIYHRTGAFVRADSLYQVVIREAQKTEEASLSRQATYFRGLLPSASPASSESSPERAWITQLQVTGDTLSPAYADACYRWANALVADQAWEDAIPWYRRALTVHEVGSGSDSTQYAGILHNLGVIALFRGNPPEAAQQIAQAYAIRQKLYPVGAGEWWTSLDNLANAYYQNNDDAQAEALYKSLDQPDTIHRYPWQYAVALSNRASVYQQQERFHQAETYYARAARHLKTQTLITPDQKLHQAAIFYNVARNQQKLARFDSAVYYFKQAVEVIRQVKGTQSSEYVAAVNGMAALYHDIGYFVESEIFYQKALRIEADTHSSQTNTYASLLNNYALVCQALGNLHKATDLLDQSLKIKEAILGTDHPEFVLALANVGLVHLEAARYQQARPLLEMALATTIARDGEEHPSTIQPHLNLARLEMAQGAYPQAEQWLQKAAATAKMYYSPFHPEYARTQIELANLYMVLGNYAAAQPLLAAGQQILKDRYGANHPEYATATQNLAGLYEAMGRTDTAEVLYQEALRVDRQTLGKQHPAYATGLNNLAALYQNQGNYAKAQPLLEESLTISQTLYGEEHPRYTTTLLNLGLLHQSIREYELARRCIEEVVSIRRRTLNENHPDYAFSLYCQAVLYHAVGDAEQAEPIFREVVQRYTYQLQEYFPALSEKEKSAFFRRVEPVLHAVQDFIIDRVINQTPAETSRALLGDFYNLELLTKAILLHSSSQIKAAIASSNDAELAIRYQQWLSTKETLVRLYALPPTEWQQQRARVGSLEERANRLEKELSLRSAEFANDLKDRRLTWQEVQQQLQPEEAAIEIVRVEKERDSLVFYVALGVTPASNAPSMVVLPTGLAMETKNFFYYKNAITFRLADKLSYDLYWKPLESLLSSQTTTVYLAPDGVYHKVSLNSLLNPSSDRFLIEETTVRMLSSTRELLQPPAVPRPPEAYLLGDPSYQLATRPIDTLPPSPEDLSTASSGFNLEGLSHSAEDKYLDTLPGTEREVERLAQLLRNHQWKTHTYFKKDATEEAVKQLDAPRLLHIATHGYFMSDLLSDHSASVFGLHVPNASANPLLRSGLLLAGAENSLHRQFLAPEDGPPQEDGVLTAYEAMNLNLTGTELVVLSACETGLGEIRNGEGVYGLQRAFLVAGAEGVLMSLWKVNDQATAKLMQLFYERWLSGEDKATALRAAQLAMMKTYPDPYYWGAFVLVGR